MSTSTVLPARGRAQAAVPSVLSPLEMALHFVRVHGRHHRVRQRWGWIRGTYWECEGCDGEAIDRGDGEAPTCEVGYLARLLGRVPHGVTLYAARVHEKTRVVPQLPDAWRAA